MLCFCACVCVCNNCIYVEFPNCDQVKQGVYWTGPSVLFHHCWMNDAWEPSLTDPVLRLGGALPTLLIAEPMDYPLRPQLARPTWHISPYPHQQCDHHHTCGEETTPYVKLTHIDEKHHVAVPSVKATTVIMWVRGWFKNWWETENTVLMARVTDIDFKYEWFTIIFNIYIFFKHTTLCLFYRFLLHKYSWVLAVIYGCFNRLTFAT